MHFNMHSIISDQKAKQLSEKLFDMLIAEGLFKNCTLCSHWNHSKEICNKYKARPPVTVIVKACVDFDADTIPF